MKKKLRLEKFREELAFGISQADHGQFVDRRRLSKNYVREAKNTDGEMSHFVTVTLPSF